MNPLKTFLLMCALCLMVAGCSTPGEKTSEILKKEADSNVVHDKFTIRPSGSYEECIELRPGMVFEYDFDASDFVNFNIHYHGEQDLHYPVSRKGVKMGEGMIDPDTHHFYTEEQEFYCLMWDNINIEPVNVSFTCVLKEKHKGRKTHH